MAVDNDDERRGKNESPLLLLLPFKVGAAMKRADVNRCGGSHLPPFLQSYRGSRSAPMITITNEGESAFVAL